jgi:hypothetical protein
VKSPFLQTLPVGSVVFSVLAEDKDTGTAGLVQYFIEKVSVKSPWGPRWEPASLCLTSTRGQHLHRQPQPWLPSLFPDHPHPHPPPSAPNREKSHFPSC